MPAPPTYPGIRVEETPGGPRTIAGVSTSDAAFVDFFLRGPLDTAVRLTGVADFQRVFGGLHPRSEASYALEQYFRNGGRTAWVVRVVAEAAPGRPSAVPARLELPGGSPEGTVLTVEAVNPGAWGNSVQVAVVQPDAGVDRFDLLVREVVSAEGLPVVLPDGRAQVITAETHSDLSMDADDSRYAPAVVNAHSGSVRVESADRADMPTAVAPGGRGEVPEDAFIPLQNGDDGDPPDSAALVGDRNRGTGMYALDRVEPFDFNLLCLPAAATLDAPEAAPATPHLRRVVSAAQRYCEEKRAFLIVDVPAQVDTVARARTWLRTNDVRHRNSAAYFPRLLLPDPLDQNRPRNVGTSGTLAGVYARTDALRGVWKPPAGSEAVLRGVSLEQEMTDTDDDQLVPLGINTLRHLPVLGTVSWGARTLDGVDGQAGEWTHVPVRRTALFLEQSLSRGLTWAVFEPNDEPLWAQIRRSVGVFMQGLFRQGAFQGTKPDEAYFVRCGRDTTNQSDIDRGVVTIVVGFAPLTPAEFVILEIRQSTSIPAP